MNRKDIDSDRVSFEELEDVGDVDFDEIDDPRRPRSGSKPPPIPNRLSAPPPIPLVARRRVRSSHVPSNDALQAHASFAHSLETHIAEGAHGTRLARLLVELARVNALHLQDLPTAAKHYARAMRAAPDMLSAVQGARITLCALDRARDALPLFDAETRLLSSPRQRAQLLYEKGKLFEKKLEDRPQALTCYRAAHELDRQNALVLATLARFAEHNASSKEDDRRELDRRLEQLGNLAKGDAASRCAFALQRALLAESNGKTEHAITLYESALQDEESDVSLEALDRLYALSGRQRERAGVLLRRAKRTQDPESQAYLLLESGRLLETLGNEIDAHQTYLQALSAAPDLPPVLEAVARTAAQTGDWKRSANVHAKMAEHQNLPLAQRARAYCGLGDIYERQLGQREQAITAYRQSLKLSFSKDALDAARTLLELEEKWSDVVSIILLEAEHSSDRSVQAHLVSTAATLAETQLGDLDQATELYQRAIQIAPGNVDAFRALQRLLKGRQRWRELVQIYEAHLDHVSGVGEQVVMLLDIAGLYENELRDLPMAVHTYERIVEIDSSSLCAILGLQRTAQAEEQYAVLLRALEREAELVSSPARLSQVLHRGAQVAERLLDDRKSALLWLKRALAVDAAHMPTLHAVARVAQAMGRWEDLIEAYETIACSAEPEAQAYYYTQISTTAEQQLGNKEKALHFSKLAVEAFPPSREAFDRLSELLAQEERWNELAQAIEKRIETCPNDRDVPQLALRAGRIYLEHLDEADKAENAFAFARKQAPTELGTWRTLEQLYEKREAWDQVEDILYDAVVNDVAKLEPAHRAALCARGSQLCIERLNDPSKAAEYLDIGLSINPTHPLLLRLRTRLNARVDKTTTSLVSHTTLAEQIEHTGLMTAHLHEAAELCTGDAALITLAEQILRADPADALAAQQLRLSAARSGDLRKVSAASSALSTLTEDEFARSLHLSTRAEIHEQLGELDQALDAYRLALTEDAENLAAVRGISRVARVRDDPNLLAEAARCAARAADDPSAAASLLTRSAHVRVHRLNDPLGARRDLERALDLAPGHEHATSALIELLSAPEQRKDLIQLLSRSANTAKRPAQQQSLWLRVADLQEDSQNRTGAISALSRVLRIEPEDTGALLRLASLYAADRQWTESVNLLNQIIRSQPSREALQQAHISLARIWHTHLGDSDRARVSLRAVLALDAYNIEALTSLVRIHCDEGDPDEARNLSRRLVEGAATAEERANGYLLLSEVEKLAGRNKDALSYALQAYEVVGPSEQALRNVEDLATGRQPWEAYGNAISKYIARQSEHNATPEDAIIHLADLWWNRLGNQQQALDVYKMSLPFADTTQVRMAYARRLVDAGSPKKAMRVLQKLLARELDTPEAWRLLGQIRGRQEGAFAERVCIEVVRGLGADTHGDAELIADAPPRNIPDVVAHEQAWLMHFPDEGYAHTLRELLATIGPALPKLFSTQLEEYDLDPGSDSRTEAAEDLCNALCILFDIEAIELRFHDVRAQGASFGFGTPATLFLPHGAMEWSKPELCFHISRWLVAHRLGLAPVLRLSAHEIQTTMVSALRIHDKTYGSGTNAEDLLAKQSKLIGRAVGRKGRKHIVALAEKLQSHRRIVYEDWCRQMTYACDRIAAVLCDELAVALANASSNRDELLRFWTSESADRLRQAVGLPR